MRGRWACGDNTSGHETWSTLRNPSVKTARVNYALRLNLQAALPTAGRYLNSKIRQNLHPVGDRGLEPPTPSLSSNRNHDASDSSKALALTPSAACTSACTSEGENANADAPEVDQGNANEEIDQGRGSSTTDQTAPLAKLAAALLTLSPADRERLASMLNGNRENRLVDRE